MEVCNEPDFKEAVETLTGEMSADDTSHFDLATASGKESGKDEVNIDSLYAEYDSIVDQGLNEKSDEYQELREKIRMFIEAKDLDVRISRTKNNLQLLEEIDEALDAQAKQPKEQPKEDPTPAPAPARRRAPKPKAEEPEEDPEEGDDEGQDPDPDETEEAPAAPAPAPETGRRARRARPGSEAETASEPDPEPEAPEEKEDEAPASDSVHPRRLHKRRLR